MTKRDLDKAKQLASEGLLMSENLRDDNRDFFRELPNSYFAIAAAISLTWTKHAKYKPEFITYASNYIDGMGLKDETMALRYCLRFGPDELDSAMLNYRKYYKAVRTIMPDFYDCDVHDLAKLQQRLLNKLHTLRNDGSVTGIGPWLFTGPFKIILSDQDRLWNQKGIDSIILPTGIEVDRGIKRLIDEEYRFVNDFDSHWLEQETNSLIENYATYCMVHTYIAGIGQATDTPAVHINSGLYRYGRKDI